MISNYRGARGGNSDAIGKLVASTVTVVPERGRYFHPAQKRCEAESGHKIGQGGLCERKEKPTRGDGVA